MYVELQLKSRKTENKNDNYFRTEAVIKTETVVIFKTELSLG